MKSRPVRFGRAVALAAFALCQVLHAGAPPDVQAVEKKLSALEAALKAGVLSQEEYDRKAAALEAQLPAPTLDEATRKKLEALEAALKAGILTEQEYQRKRAALLPQTPTLDPAVQKKLDALDEAQKAGILSDAELARKKAELLGAQPAAAPPEPEPLAARKGKTYKHVLGFTFWYPEGWTVQKHEEFLHLVPPDAAKVAGGAAEVYAIVGDNAAVEGIQTPDDPRVLQFLDQQIASVSRFVTRQGQPKAVDMARGKGVELVWAGKNTEGKAIEARAFVTMLKGYGIALIGVGFQEQMAARDADLRRMFASFGVGESQKDPALFGHWIYEKHYFSGTFSSTTVRHLILLPDGRFSQSSRLLASMEHVDGGGDATGTTNMDTGGDPGQRGHWAAANKMLYLLWDDGSQAEYRYFIRVLGNDRHMSLTPPGGKLQLWTYSGR